MVFTAAAPPAAGRAASSLFPRRCAAFSFFSVCTTPSFRPLDTAPELHDNKKLRIDKCKAGVWNVGFPRAGADAGKHTAPLQTQKRVTAHSPSRVSARLVSTLLEILRAD